MSDNEPLYATAIGAISNVASTWSRPLSAESSSYDWAVMLCHGGILSRSS